jgi:hypothetical protein
MDPRSRFGEPSAPEEPEPFLNAISLCYRIRRSTEPVPPDEPPEADEGFRKTAHVCGIDLEELIVNPLPLVAGITLIEQGHEATLSLAQRRAAAHWRWLHQYPPFQQYALKDVAPMLGIRESYRVVTDYVLTERDVRAGLDGQRHADIVAIADHALDTHGGGHGIEELSAPYGVPYRCLIPRGVRNVLVACRGAGFSHLAASSCRLSRTLTALGHAAGLAAAEGAGKSGDVRDIDVPRLVERMTA